MDEILKDDRFSHIATDPRFKRIPKSEHKVKIDKRFQSMFNDKNFKIKYTVDKRGRPVQHSSREDLKKYYDLESSDDESSSENDEDKEKEAETGQFVRAPPEYSHTAEENDEEVVSEHIKTKLRDLQVDYARGEGKLMSESSSSDDESDNEEQSDDEIIEHQWGELDKDAETTDEATYRLAVCNMDWDRIRAVDLMVLFNSFLPSGGLIRSITIYPSEYGLQRMKEEEINGPPELVVPKEEIEDESNEEENEEGSSYHMEKLRQYQLNRLKYYYAVIECDTANTANKLYTECDGLEYESSATRFDLRFIPDDTTFDQEPKDVCTQLPDLSRYEPRNFTTTALQQAKVELTWDETNPERAEVAQKLMSGKIDDITDADLQNYLASSSGSDSEASDEDNKVSDAEEDGHPMQDDKKINKYKALLQEIDKNEEKKEQDIQMEVSWGVSLKEKTDEIIKKKKDSAETLTPFEKYLEKKKEKRKLKKAERKKLKTNNQEENDDLVSDDIPSDIDMNDPYFAEEFKNGEFPKKKSKNKKKSDKVETNDEDIDNNNAELELLLMDDKPDSKHHFSLKKIQEQENQSTKTKRKKKYKKTKTTSNDKETVEDDFQLNVNDERFSALFQSHHYNIDPADPHYRKTKAMETLIQEKIKRRNKEVRNSDEPKAKNMKNNTELNVLVKAVKRKSKQAFNKK